MTGWMLTEQADLFGLEMDALTPQQAAKLLEIADSETSNTDDGLTGGNDSDGHASSDFRVPAAGDEADLPSEEFGVFDGAAGVEPRAAEWCTADEGVETRHELVPTARHYEFVCAGCFLIWHRRLLGDKSRRLCRDCTEDMLSTARRSA